MRILKIILVSLLIIITNLSSYGQSIVHQDLLWMRYYNKLNFTEKFSLHTEFEERMYVNPYREHQRLLPRIGINYSPINDIEFNIGFTYFQQYLPHDAKTSPSLFNEFRPHQSVSLTNNNSRFKVKTRLQLEQRFVEQADKSFGFNLRERLMIQLVFPIIRKNNISRLEAIVFNEIMVQQGSGLRYNFFDQNRIGGGLKSSINKALQIEAIFFKWHQQQSTLVDYFSRNIVRLSLIHTIQL